ncbi:MAG: transposase [Flavobacteriaceae bacterium]|jgi:transposase|tara:strand:+ start:67 stop:375 length:309 start_codon:yes stop_codon:yes gene_type:complete
MSRRKFTSSFKLNAIKLGEEKQNIAQAARELGLKPSLIHRWKREQEEFSHNSFPGHGKVKMTDEQREIASLKKSLRDAKMETEILKKAISIFSKSDKRNLDL